MYIDIVISNVFNLNNFFFFSWQKNLSLICILRLLPIMRVKNTVENADYSINYAS